MRQKIVSDDVPITEWVVKNCNMLHSTPKASCATKMLTPALSNNHVHSMFICTDPVLLAVWKAAHDMLPHSIRILVAGALN